LHTNMLYHEVFAMKSRSERNKFYYFVSCPCVLRIETNVFAVDADDFVFR